MTDVLLVDANADRCAATTNALREYGIEVTSFTALPSLAQLAERRHECLVIDAETIEAKLTDVAKLIPVIVIAEQASIPAAVACIHRGAANYLALPAAPDELVAAVERARSLASAHTTLDLEQFSLIGSSEQMRVLKEGVEKVAPTDSTVLIQGPSGTGKELVARAIHAASRRANAPLITINCATVPPNLIETELFGVEQFDTSETGTTGLVNAANGGTLFLDEIAELPAAAQARLLRVMQGENRPVGASVTHAVDVRIIAATHRNLADAAQADQFREDLFYRLNVVRFQLAPLRSRGEDVIEIAEWLLSRTSARLQKPKLKFDTSALEAMRSYHWPGNVRELENAIERAVILSDNEGLITQSLLAIEPAAEQRDDVEPVPDAETSLEDYFVRFVLDNQDHCTETELAEKLGISRKSLWERRQRLNIPRRKTKKRGPRREPTTK